jgi:hypothetical protein
MLPLTFDATTAGSPFLLLDAKAARDTFAH